MSIAEKQDFKFLIKAFDKTHGEAHRYLQIGLAGTTTSTVIFLYLIPQYAGLGDTGFLPLAIKVIGLASLLLLGVILILSLLGLQTDKGVFKAIELSKKIDKVYGYMTLRPHDVTVFSNLDKSFNIPLTGIISYEMSLPNKDGLTEFIIHISPDLIDIIPLTSGYGIVFVLERTEVKRLLDYINQHHIHHFRVLA